MALFQSGYVDLTSSSPVMKSENIYFMYVIHHHSSGPKDSKVNVTHLVQIYVDARTSTKVPAARVS